MATQFHEGGQGVQVSNASNSQFFITYTNGDGRSSVPLQRAALPPPSAAKSPALLIRARSALIPFAARRGLHDELANWLDSETAFATVVIEGAGGTGKTRLAVELCAGAEKKGWLAGMLVEIDDLASLEALADAPLGRLIVVDYAEWRAPQMEVLLQLLAARAKPEAPVRVLLLVRAVPTRARGWGEGLANRSDLLDNILEECQTHVLDDAPLQAEEREELFAAASSVFSDTDSSAPSADLRYNPAFASPLMVVLAAYLVASGETAPRTREDLLRAVISHETRYWRLSSERLFGDAKQPRQVIALATLLNATDEETARQLLALLPDFSDASSERLGLVARWAAERYPGGGWWNPLEPDPIGEQLVAEEFIERPQLLSRALQGDGPAELVRPLEVLGRAAADHVRFAAVLQPILGDALPRLCKAAVAEVCEGASKDLLYGRAVTLAAVLEKAVSSVEIDQERLSQACAALPNSFDLVLSPLALTLFGRLADRERNLATSDPDRHELGLARALVELSRRLLDLDQGTEALATAEESVRILRGGPSDKGVAGQHGLATALNSLSVCLLASGHPSRALAASEESVQLRRDLAAHDPVAHELRLAHALTNLSIVLGQLGRLDESLKAIEGASEIYSRLTRENPDAHESDRAAVLNNFSNRLADVGRLDEALKLNEESIRIRSQLASISPTAQDRDLAMAMNNRSSLLAQTGRIEEALNTSEQAVEIHRRLAAASPSQEPSLAMSLNNYSAYLAEVGRSAEALAASRESVAIRRRLATLSATAQQLHLAAALTNHSRHLAEVGCHQESLRANEESVAIYRQYQSEGLLAHEHDLAIALDYLSLRHGEAGQLDQALGASRECLEIYRRLAAIHPAARRPNLVGALRFRASLLRAAGRDPEAEATELEADQLGQGDTS